MLEINRLFGSTGYFEPDVAIWWFMEIYWKPLVAKSMCPTYEIYSLSAVYVVSALIFAIYAVKYFKKNLQDQHQINYMFIRFIVARPSMMVLFCLVSKWPKWLVDGTSPMMLLHPPKLWPTWPSAHRFWPGGLRNDMSFMNSKPLPFLLIEHVDMLISLVFF